jgi:TolB-like protein
MKSTSLALQWFALAVAVTSVVSAGDARAADPSGKKTLAISYFDNNSGDAALDSLSRGLADMLITDLGGISAIQIVERDKLNVALKELELSRSKFIDPKTALKLGKGLAATWVLTGGYVIAGDTMRIDARVFQVDNGKVLASDKVEGPRDDFFALEKDLVEALIRTLSLEVQTAERSALRRNPTQSWDAFRNYSLGLTLADKGDDAGARAAFEKALAADPSYKAAKDATGRLKAIFAMTDASKDDAWDRDRKALDPKAADFAAKVSDLLRRADTTTNAGMKRHIALLDWLDKSNLEPRSPPLSPIPFQALALASRLTDDPSMDDAVLGACEYFIRSYPAEDYPQSYCKGLVRTIAANQKGNTAAERKKSFEEDVAWELAQLEPDDWRMAIRNNYDALKALIRGYAKKAKP